MNRNSRLKVPMSGPRYPEALDARLRFLLDERGLKGSFLPV